MDKLNMLSWIIMAISICQYTCKALNKVQCPIQCTCTALPYEGLKTNCSGLSNSTMNEVFKNISPLTHNL